MKPRARKGARKIRTPDVTPPDLSLLEVTLGGERYAVLSFAVRPEHEAIDEETTLTPAEQEVVALARDGYSNREIAKHRAVSPRTIANQLASAFTKLGVSSRRELSSLDLQTGRKTPR